MSDAPEIPGVADLPRPAGDPPALPDPLALRARTHAAHPALVADDASWGYAELHARARAAALRLAALGVGAGDRVATLLHNSAGLATLAHAVPRLGATLLPLNVRLTAAELAWQVGDARPSVLVAHGATAPLAAALHRELRTQHVEPPPRLVAASRADAAALHADPSLDDDVPDAPLRDAFPLDAVHTVLYTSGTTGRPKGAQLTVGNHWWSAVGSALVLGVRPDDRWLAVLPLFHVGGLAILLRSALYGTTAVVHEAFDAARVARAIDEEGVTIVSLVATMLQRVLDARGDRVAPASLRTVLLGGGPAPRPLLERCARLGVPVVQTYGLTETASQAATLPPSEALARLGSAGRALWPNELRVGTVEAPLPPDAEGEILVRGPIVTAGYLGRPEETARARAGAWLHTGDVGRMDAHGYLYVLDRRDDLIVSGGENVYPAEVEAALLAHADVAEAGVVGVPDAQWGQRVVAVVRLHPGAAADAGALRLHCRARLAGYKVPARVELADAPLPRTASGKLLRRALRERVAAPGTSRDEGS